MVLSKALYGCEAAPIASNVLDKLTTTLRKAMGFRGHFTSNDLAFQVSNEAGDLDPRLNVYLRRFTLLRRVLARSPEYLTKVTQLVKMYGDLSTPGTLGALGKPYTKAAICWGPIGLLLDSANEYGCVISEGMRLTSFASSTDFDIMELPWQDYKPRLVYLAQRARFENVRVDRKEYKDANRPDFLALHNAAKQVGGEIFNRIKSLLALGRWNKGCISAAH